MQQIIKKLTVISVFAMFMQYAMANSNQFHHFGIPISNADKNEFMQLEAAFAAAANDQPAAARKIFDRLISNNPQLAMAKIGQMSTVTSRSDFDSLVNSALKMEGLSAGEVMIINSLGAFLKRDLEEYLAISKKLTEEYPKSSWAWRLRGNALSIAKQIDDARNANDKAISADSDDTLAYEQAANSYLFSEPRDFDKAQTYVEQGIKAQPASQSLFIALGDVFRAKNDLADAQQFYQVAATLSSQNYVAHVKQGHANTFLGNYDEARENYLAALNIGEAEYNIGMGNFHAYTYLYEGKPEQALKAMQKWVSKVDQADMEDAAKQEAKMGVYSDIAMTALNYDMLPEAKSAVTNYESLLTKQMPNMTEANDKNAYKAYLHYLQGMVALKSDDTENAMTHAESMKALMEPMNNARKYELYHEFVGHIEMHKANYSQALNHLKQADQNDMFVKYHTAMLMDKNGEKAAAKSMLADVGRHNFNGINYALVRNDALKFQ